MIRQVSSLLLCPTEKLKIQLNVGLVDGNGQPNYCGLYRGEGNSYLSISPKPYISIRYTEKGRPWSRRDGIMINQRNIYKLKLQMGHFYKTLLTHEEEIYQYDGNGYIISMNDTEPYQETIYLGMGQVMRLTPTTLYDEKNKPFPGVFLYVNQMENEAELSIEEFESILELFRTVNLRQEGMALLQAYLTLCMKDGEISIPIDNSFDGGKKAMYQPSSKRDMKVNVFEAFGKSHQGLSKTSEQKEMVQGPNIEKPPTTLEELG